MFILQYILVQWKLVDFNKSISKIVDTMENGSSEPLNESTENKYKNQTINGILKWVRNVFKS